MRSNYTAIQSPGLRILSDDQIREIFSNTLMIMEKTGQVVSNDEAVELLLSAGASKMSNGRISIPSHMVEEAIRTAPKRIDLYDRDGNLNVRLEGNYTNFGALLDAVDFIDPETGKRRKYESKDWVSAARVYDYLPNIKFAHICGNANDYDNPHLAFREIGYHVLMNTRITIGLCMGNKDAMSDLIEVFETVAGGPEEFKRKPNIFAMSEPVTPLEHPDDSTARILMCAEHKVPIVYYGMQMQGTTGPATDAGVISLALAETFAGLVIHQLKNPGAPYIVGAIPAMLNFKTTMFSYGNPELTKCSMAISDVAHYFHLPVWGTTTTDSKTIDAQGATEFALSSMAAMLNGQNLIHDCAQMDKAELVSLQGAVLCDTIISNLNYIQAGIKVNEETLAYDVIDRVGPQGNFMSQKQTLKNFKSFWSSDIFDCSVPEKEVEPIEQRINNKVMSILENHKIPALPDDTQKKVDELRNKWLAKYK